MKKIFGLKKAEKEQRSRVEYSQLRTSTYFKILFDKESDYLL